MHNGGLPLSQPQLEFIRFALLGTRTRPGGLGSTPKPGNRCREKQSQLKRLKTRLLCRMPSVLWRKCRPLCQIGDLQ